MSEDAGFWDTLASLIPLGLAGTFSWLPVTGVVVLLPAPEGRARVPAFVAGRVVGLALVTGAFVAGARALPHVPSFEGPVVASAEVVVGLALVLVGLVSWLRRHRAHHHGRPAWMERLGDAPRPAVFTTSLLIDLQPKGLLLGLSAAVVLRRGSMPLGVTAVAVVIYLAVAASSVLLLAIAASVAPVRTGRWLQESEAWLSAHGSLVTAVVAALVGLVLVVDGLSRF